VDALRAIDGWRAGVAAAGVAHADAVVATHGLRDAALPWASVTKLLTGLALLVALEEGTVDLDEPAGPPGATLRHLLAHASGLPVDGDEPLTEPGRRRIYSNTGIELAARLLAERAEMPFADYFAHAVVRPLGLAGSLVLMAMASRYRMLRSLVLTATAVVILQDTAGTTGALMVRFQWVAAAGAVLLVSRSLLAWYQGGPKGSRLVEDQLMLGLLLLAVGAHDPLGLGALAAILLLVDLALVRAHSSDRDLLPGGRLRWLAQLATSSWPPAVRFAAVTVAVAAVLQTSLPWGLLAAGFLAALKLVPLIRRDDRPLRTAAGRTARAWLGPAMSLACGVAPALVLRMLRV